MNAAVMKSPFSPNFLPGKNLRQHILHSNILCPCWNICWTMSYTTRQGCWFRNWFFVIIANSFLIREFHGIKTSQLALDVNTFDNIIDAGTANVTHVVRTAKVFAEWACRAVPEVR